MDYREDWDRSRQRFKAFWQRELVDRCCIAIRAPRKDAPPSPRVAEGGAATALPPLRGRADVSGANAGRGVAPLPALASLVSALPHEGGRASTGRCNYDNSASIHRAELLRSWLDPELNLRRMLSGFERTYYGGEAYPAATMCLGASVMAAFYGAKVEFRPETVWFHPTLDTLSGHDWTIDLPSAPLYRETIDAARYYAQESRGRYLVGLPELGSVADNLSLLRGMENLLYDMLDEPEEVKRAVTALAKVWGDVHRKLYVIALPANDGGCCIPWMQTWAPGPHYQMSCDFSAVQSPELFREFSMPEIEAYLRVNEYSVYHWDGPDAVKHLDALLELKSLKAIQWTPGDGQAPTSSPRWLPNYQRIQAAGKCLVLPFVRADEVETLLSQLSSRGLFMSVWASSEDEARQVLANVGRWTRE